MNKQKNIKNYFKGLEILNINIISSILIILINNVKNINKSNMNDINKELNINADKFISIINLLCNNVSKELGGKSSSQASIIRKRLSNITQSVVKYLKSQKDLDLSIFQLDFISKSLNDLLQSIQSPYTIISISDEKQIYKKVQILKKTENDFKKNFLNGIKKINSNKQKQELIKIQEYDEENNTHCEDIITEFAQVLLAYKCHKQNLKTTNRQRLQKIFTSCCTAQKKGARNNINMKEDLSFMDNEPENFTLVESTLEDSEFNSIEDSEFNSIEDSEFNSIEDSEFNSIEDSELNTQTYYPDTNNFVTKTDQYDIDQFENIYSEVDNDGVDEINDITMSKSEYSQSQRITANIEVMSNAQDDVTTFQESNNGDSEYKQYSTVSKKKKLHISEIDNALKGLHDAIDKLPNKSEENKVVFTNKLFTIDSKLLLEKKNELKKIPSTSEKSPINYINIASTQPKSNLMDQQNNAIKEIIVDASTFKREENTKPSPIIIDSVVNNLGLKKALCPPKIAPKPKFFFNVSEPLHVVEDLANAMPLQTKSNIESDLTEPLTSIDVAAVTQLAEKIKIMN